jgi:hypothetical protein
MITHIVDKNAAAPKANEEALLASSSADQLELLVNKLAQLREEIESITSARESEQAEFTEIVAGRDHALVRANALLRLREKEVTELVAQLSAEQTRRAEEFARAKEVERTLTKGNDAALAVSTITKSEKPNEKEIIPKEAKKAKLIEEPVAFAEPKIDVAAKVAEELQRQKDQLQQSFDKELARVLSEAARRTNEIKTHYEEEVKALQIFVEIHASTLLHTTLCAPAPEPTPTHTPLLLSDESESLRAFQHQLESMASKYHAEVYSLQAQVMRLTSELEKSKKPVVDEKKLAEAQRELEKVKTDWEKDVKKIRSEYEKSIQDLNCQHEKLIQDLKHQHDDAIIELKTTFQKDQVEKDKHHSKAVKDINDQHAKAIKELTSQHAASLNTAKESAQGDFQKLQAQLKQLQESDTKHNADTEKLKTSYQAEIKTLTTKLNDAQKAMVSAQEASEKLKKEHDAHLTKVTSTQAKELMHAVDQHKQTSYKLLDTQVELKKKEAAEAEAKKSLTQAQSQLEAEKAKAAELAQKVSALQASIADVTAQKQKLQQQTHTVYNDLVLFMNRLTKGTKPTREGSLVWVLVAVTVVIISFLLSR